MHSNWPVPDNWKRRNKDMRALSLSLLMVSLLIFSGYAWGEGSCPQGMYPQGGRDVVVCAPIPGYGSGESNEDSNPPPISWIDSWGAISIDNSVKTGGIGTVVGMRSKRQAEKAALAECRASGGGAGCKINLSYSNQCGAVAWGNDYLTTARAETIALASQDAELSCSRKTTDCKIFYADCSLPVRAE